MSDRDFISLEDVWKLYAVADLPALDGVDLSISEGEFVALMGPSGSGKSTLLTILGAMNKPTRGSVRFEGIDVYGLTDERRADFRNEYLGFVFQQHHLMPYLTAVENVELPLVVTRLGAREKRELALRALESVGLGDMERRLPSELSGGEQARVAIARAVVNEPPLILADEPTGNLDSGTGRAVMELLSELNRAGHTVVVVTHDESVARLARRVVRLLDGQVVGDSSLGDSDPARDPQAEFLDDHDRAAVESRR
jgi:putative ABC transport system ATP-binding protein